jgi:hypothetical protein
MNEIIIALISGLCVGVPSVIATLSSNKKTTSLITYRIEQLEDKTEKHNQVMERQFKLETEFKDLKDFVNKMHK